MCVYLAERVCCSYTCVWCMPSWVPLIQCSKIPSHTHSHKSREITTPHWKCPKLAGFTGGQMASLWYVYKCYCCFAQWPFGTLVESSQSWGRNISVVLLFLPLAVGVVAVRKQSVALSFLAHGGIKTLGRYVSLGFRALPTRVHQPRAHLFSAYGKISKQHPVQGS